MTSGRIEVSLVDYRASEGVYRNAWVQSGGRDFYHSPAWLEILKETVPALRMSVFEFRRADGTVAAWLPVTRNRFGKYVSLPMSPGVDFLFSGETGADPILMAALFDAADKQGLRFEYRSRSQATAGHASSDYFSSMLNGLQRGGEHLGFSSNVRRNIKKAKACGVVVKESDNFDLMWEFLHRTRRRQGSPMYPAGLKQALQKAQADGAPIRLLFSCSKDGSEISGIILFEDRSKITYAFGANCEDKELLSTGANFVLFAHCIDDAIARGVDVFDFGITPRDNMGLVRFKEQFGVESKPATILRSQSVGAGVKRSGRAVTLVSNALRTVPDPVYRRFSPFLFQLLV